MSAAFLLSGASALRSRILESTRANGFAIKMKVGILTQQNEADNARNAKRISTWLQGSSKDFDYHGQGRVRGAVNVP